ncbi:MAG: response regulator [Chthoniobacterales bacterium]
MICGIVIIALGLTVLTGWYTDRVELLRIRSNFAPMHFITASCFILSGFALIFLAMRYCRLAMLLGGIVGLVGALLCIEYSFGVKIGFFDALLAHLPAVTGLRPARPSPPTAAGFAGCGIALVILGSRISSRVQRPVIWIIGSFVMALCFMAISGYMTGLTGTYAWGNFVGMAFHTATGMSVLALGILLTQGRSHHGRTFMEDRWLPLPFGIAVATATVILWQALMADQQHKISQDSRIVAEGLKSNLVSQLNSRFRAILRMGRRWDRRGGTPYDDWKGDSMQYLKDENFAVAVEWVDSTLHVRWVYPEGENSEHLNFDLKKDIRWHAEEILKKSQIEFAMTVSPVLDLKQGGKGLSAYVPLFPNNKFDGYIVGVFRMDILMDTLLFEANITNYSVSVFEGEQLIYGPPLSNEGTRAVMNGSATTNFYGRTWRLVLTPTPALITKTTSALPHLILFLGLILTIALVVAARALQMSRLRAYSLTQSNERLQQEIQEREQIQIQLRESEDRLRVVLTAATGVSVVAGDRAGLITYFSSGSEKMLGYSAQEVVGKLTPGVFHDREEVAARGEELSVELGKKIEGIEVFTTKPLYEGIEKREWTYICKDGTRKKVELTVTVIRDADKNITGFLGTAVDITERKRLEQSKREAAELLAERNRQLEIVTAQAQAHAKAKAEFLSNMSHEIRTPLNAIIGMSELLLDVAMERREREYAETIRTSGDALLGLINDILDFSKIEAGQLEIEHIPVDLHECVESALDLVSAQATKKTLDLLYWIEPSVPAFILGDVTRLRQVLVNLVMNGVKFTEHGEIFVRISKTTCEGVKECLHISVHDTGVGIPKDRQDRLFRAFSQVDASTTRRYGGTGLGLAICHRLVTLMQGRIWVESEPGKGANFQFEFPLEAASVMLPRVYQQGASQELDGLRVLIVDDNETNRWILQTQTTAWGMQARSTDKPQEALEWVERGDPFDLAILDAEMPDMDGYELAEKLRQHHTTRKLSILVLTSKGDHRQDLEKLGIKAHLTKPVKVAALFEVVGSLLLGRRILRRSDEMKTEKLLFSECPLKILIAEDNPINQRVVTLLLERLGYRSEAVGNGLEVLAAVQRTSFDVILMDVQMPEMDGLHAARELCHLYSREKRPYIIALTADAEEGDREECLSAGMDDYLSKPVRSNKLAEVLRHAFVEIKKIKSAR